MRLDEGWLDWKEQRSQIIRKPYTSIYIIPRASANRDGGEKNWHPQSSLSLRNA